jgi:hypothetical protein
MWYLILRDFGNSLTVRTISNNGIVLLSKIINVNNEGGKHH